MKTTQILAVLLLAGTLNTLPAQPSVPSTGVQGSSGLVLDRAWDSILAGNVGTMKELATLLSPLFQPNVNTAPDPSLEIYQGVTYLMPLEQAKAKLVITQRLSPKIPVTCPGFPKDSFSDYVVTGTFDGDYDQMHIVVDSADQVVSIQLVASNPRKRVTHNLKDEGWHTFNFIGNRTRAVTSIWIFHEVQFQENANSTYWHTYKPTSDASKTGSHGVVRIESEAIAMKPHSSSPGHGRIIEAGRWYVPRPLAELILYCVRKNG